MFLGVHRDGKDQQQPHNATTSRTLHLSTLSPSRSRLISWIIVLASAPFFFSNTSELNMRRDTEVRVAGRLVPPALAESKSMYLNMRFIHSVRMRWFVHCLHNSARSSSSRFPGNDGQTCSNCKVTHQSQRARSEIHPVRATIVSQSSRNDNLQNMVDTYQELANELLVDLCQFISLFWIRVLGFQNKRVKRHEHGARQQRFAATRITRLELLHKRLQYSAQRAQEAMKTPPKTSNTAWLERKPRRAAAHTYQEPKLPDFPHSNINRDGIWVIAQVADALQQILLAGALGHGKQGYSVWFCTLSIPAPNALDRPCGPCPGHSHPRGDYYHMFQ